MFHIRLGPQLIALLIGLSGRYADASELETEIASTVTSEVQYNAWVSLALGVATDMPDSSHLSINAEIVIARNDNQIILRSWLSSTELPEFGNPPQSDTVGLRSNGKLRLPPRNEYVSVQERPAILLGRSIRKRLGSFESRYSVSLGPSLVNVLASDGRDTKDTFGFSVESSALVYPIKLPVTTAGVTLCANINRYHPAAGVMITIGTGWFR